MWSAPLDARDKPEPHSIQTLYPVLPCLALSLLTAFAPPSRSSQDASQRYARALLDREASALALVEAMLVGEAEEAGRERGAAEDSLKRSRQELKDVEAEYARLQVRFADARSEYTSISSCQF